MSKIGNLRKVDELGRIVIPASLRKHTGIDIGETLEVVAKGDVILLKRYQEDYCIFCGAQDHLESRLGKTVCADCILKIQRL
ncbi:AbrB/MazE/SpoVT family DNA-binding domain-containing protein [Fusibacter sp. 3D3]|uniref:AbrB/MazE/SpoVT family DNA-binding domain-containing protein n=1 Tax=Fusibacter sp. 3D3 TaxID=1048380 RepID=UPI0008529ACD|nr:AbrB/MazE/SpoVT family DNA-binding domain-containing protein [Fusibacter sp. 3D3]GAU79489.1 transition state regulatory protein AbrB [Fusibacter sp. 3D3]